MQDRTHRVTEYRLTIWVTQTEAQEQAYRAENAVAPEESLRRHLSAHLAALLEGEGEMSGWWTVKRVR